ncbi:MAG: CpaF family protein, partial [Eggerthella sp.]|nr:CpaF family protein [Eggerthella sp.]
MSLLERVSNAQQTYSTHDAPRHTETHPNARTNDAALERFEELRSGVGSHLSSSDMGALITRNPLQARNEITQVCKRVCEERPWLAPTNRERDILINRYLDSVFGLGPLEELLADERITEIMVNGPRSVYFERDGRLYRSEQRFADEDQLRALVDRVLGPLGRRIDESSPMVNARLPQGHRVHAVIPPLALDGPVMTVRKFAKRVMTLDDMVATGSFDEAMRTFLVWAVRARKSIAVSGGTGSGKTTLLNAL